LREEGILVIGSGNLVHNLHSYAWGRDGVHAYDWVVRFEQLVRKLLLAGDDASLVAYEDLGRDAMLSVPTPDHYLPLLYILGLRGTNDLVSFPVEGVDGGSVSMLAVRIG
jgi:4,5-DOPA dioxygenase extradiol